MSLGPRGGAGGFLYSGLGKLGFGLGTGTGLGFKSYGLFAMANVGAPPF